MKLDPSAFIADPELIQALDKQATPIACGEDRVLFCQGDAPVGLFILKAGEATLTMHSPAGKQIMSGQAAAGSLLGLPGLIGSEPYTLTAIALAGAQLSFVPRDNFTTVMRTDPFLALKVLKVLAAEVRSARNAILQRGSQRPSRRAGQLTLSRMP
ncbi:MAG TPA: cyclic nucleotide-binding domain-containing protein [Terracidiphilus sp.]